MEITVSYSLDAADVEKLERLRKLLTSKTGREWSAEQVFRTAMLTGSSFDVKDRLDRMERTAQEMEARA